MWPNPDRTVTSRMLLATGASVCLLATGTMVASADPPVATWGPAVAVPADGEAFSPTLAASADGNRIVAGWHNTQGVYAAVSQDAGGTWTPTREIAAKGGLLQLRVVSSADGNNLLAMWRRRIPRQGVSFTVPRVHYSVSANGGADWTAARTVPVAGMRDYRAESTISADGRWHAIAYAQKGEGVRVIVSRNGGVTWLEPRTLPRSTSATNVQGPQLAASRDGRYMVLAWQQQDGALQASRSSNGGRKWSAPRTVAKAEPRVVPELSMSAGGQSAVLAWTGGLAGAPGGDSIPMMLSTVTGTGDSWASPRVVGEANPSSGEVSLAASGDGLRLTAVWQSPLGIAVSRSDDAGAVWSPPSTISAQAGPGYPALAGSADGLRLTATWWSDDSLRAAISLDGAQSWSAAQTISDPAGGNDSLGSAVGDTRVVSADDGVRASTVTLGAGPSPIRSISAVLPVSPQYPASPVTAVSPWVPRPVAVAKAVRSRGALKVRVKPRFGKSQQWSFYLRKRTKDGWRTLRTRTGKKKAYRTAGPRHIRVLDLARGVYKVRTLPARGFRSDTSDRVKLRY
jgi:hypothetical protein